ACSPTRYACVLPESRRSLMRMVARVDNSQGRNSVTLSTGDHTQSIEIAPKATGFGSSANGAELLLLALATCYCNYIYREAGERTIRVGQVEVEAIGDFGAPGEPASNITYRARVVADATEAQIAELMRHTDTVAEIQNTLRTPVSLSLSDIEAVSIRGTR